MPPGLAYHVILMPRPEEQPAYLAAREHLKNVLGSLAKRKDCVLLACNFHRDYVHLIVRIPPHRSVSEVVVNLKRNSARWFANAVKGKKSFFVRSELWANGYLVSTQGVDEDEIRSFVGEPESTPIVLEQSWIKRPSAEPSARVFSDLLAEASQA